MEKNEKIVLVHWIGRFGNRMFQYAFGCQYAHDHGIMYYFPSEWEGSIHFQPFHLAQPITEEELKRCLNDAGTVDDPKCRKKCVESYVNYYTDDVSFLDFNIIKSPDNQNQGYINIAFDDIAMMFFQHLISSMCIDFLRKYIFRWSDLVKGTEMYKELETKRGTYFVAHLRRGDVVLDNYDGAHSAVEKISYDREIVKLGLDGKNVIWICEDPTIATRHRWYHSGGDNGWSYPSGQKRLRDDDTVYDFLPDFLTMYFAAVILRGNSSFSWWAAELSNAEVFSPVVADRPEGMKGPHWIDCPFIQGNSPNFMGRRFDNLMLKRCDMKISNIIPRRRSFTSLTKRRRRKNNKTVLFYVLILIIGVVIFTLLRKSTHMHKKMHTSYHQFLKNGTLKDCFEMKKQG